MMPLSMLRRIYGQKTGRDAMVVAMSTSRIESTMAVEPYQVGSNVGEVVALVWTRLTKREMEQITDLFWKLSSC